MKKIDIKEFREKGYLLELNRRFLHPLGMALEISNDNAEGIEKISGVWDLRDDPEGIIFGEFDQSDIDKFNNIEVELDQKIEARDAIGCDYGIQPMKLGSSNYQDIK